MKTKNTEDKLVVLESPYSEKRDCLRHNEFAGASYAYIDYARSCMKDSLSRGEYPIASHLLYTQKGILDDTIPSQRKLGIEAGLSWSRFADYCVVYEDFGITEGMKVGIQNHIDNGKKVEYRKIYV